MRANILITELILFRKFKKADFLLSKSNQKSLVTCLRFHPYGTDLNGKWKKELFFQ